MANLGTHFGHLRLHWGVLELPWGCFGDDFGLFWASSEKKCPWEPHRKPMALKYRACAQKLTRWNLPGGPGGPGGPDETVHELPFRTYLPHAPGIRMT